MLDSLGKIQNPWLRGLTAAATVGSVLTMATAIGLGVTSDKANANYRAALYSTLAGTGCGAIFGLLYADRSQRSMPTQPIDKFPSADEPERWKNWRNFVVVRKVQESEEITSFYLQPQDQGSIPNYQPGQFLTIKLDIPGQASPVIRTYSLSDYAEPCEYYRLSIKREPSPAGSSFMPGLASNFMHDCVQEGSVIAAKPPSGKFVLDLYKPLPAVLISNGVGITPMVSMVKAATLSSNRPIWFVHGARNGDFHAFRDEIATLAQQNPNLQVHFVYSRPELADTGHYHSTGYVDTELIQSLVQQEAEYFLCGSSAFMQSLRAGLTASGVPESRIFFEAFSKSSSKMAIAPVTHSNSSGEQAEVEFAESDRIVTWRSEDGSLLELAEANDLEPAYSCRQGICGTCRCRILEGEIEYQSAPVAEVDDESVLICIAQPKTSRVVLDL